MKALKLHIIAFLVSLAMVAGNRTSTLKDYAEVPQNALVVAEMVGRLRKKE